MSQREQEIVVCAKCFREVEHLGPGQMWCKNNHGLLDISQVKLRKVSEYFGQSTTTNKEKT